VGVCIEQSSGVSTKEKPNSLKIFFKPDILRSKSMQAWKENHERQYQEKEENPSS